MAVKVKKKKKVKSNLTILRTENVALSELNKYHKNPRIGDVEKVAESLAENGQFKPIVVNVGTHTGRPNEILGGNHTFMAAKRLKWETIFVAWVDVTENNATKIVLADNGTSDGSKYDDSILTELLSGLKTSGASLVGTTYTDDVLSKLVKADQQDEKSRIDKIEDAPEDMDGVADLANGIHFSSDADYDMPELLPDMIPDGPFWESELDVWAGHELDLPRQEEDPDIWWLAQWHAGMRGVNWEQCIAMFYTGDFHFEPVFEDPAKNTKKILNLGMQYSIMPNYSIGEDWPVATWVWAAYRSFYVGRYFQEAGIKVIPDIQYGGNDAVLDLSLLGIPENAGLVATQIQNANTDKSYIRRTARLLKEAEDRKRFKHMIVYGHNDADRVLERANLSCGITRVQNRSARRREYLNSGSTINTQKVVKRKKTDKK